MLFWSLKVILFSLVFIFIIHHLLQFFKSNLTIPKTKDYVSVPTKKYDEIFSTIKREREKEEPIPEVEIEGNMKQDLMEFMRTQMSR